MTLFFQQNLGTAWGASAQTGSGRMLLMGVGSWLVYLLLSLSSR